MGVSQVGDLTEGPSVNARLSREGYYMSPTTVLVVLLIGLLIG